MGKTYKDWSHKWLVFIVYMGAGFLIAWTIHYIMQS